MTREEVINFSLWVFCAFKVTTVYYQTVFSEWIISTSIYTKHTKKQPGIKTFFIHLTKHAPVIKSLTKFSEQIFSDLDKDFYIYTIHI